MPLYKALDLIWPRYLSQDRRLNASDKALYLQLIADGTGSIARHAQGMGVSYPTARRAARRLIETGWVEEVPGYSARHIAPIVPLNVEQKVAELLVRMRERHQPVGEFLLKCVLCLLIPDRNYYDNARPPFLVDGHGSGRYEFDRLYEDRKLAFEYQGPQHFRTGGPLNITDEELEKQVTQDRIKAALCAQEGIRLFWFRVDDLSINRVRERLEGVIPLRSLRQNRPVVRTVERMCHSLVNYARRNES